MIKKSILLLLFLIGFSFYPNAQDKSVSEIIADKYLKTCDYKKAIKYYKKTKNITTEGERNLASSYFNMRLTIEAEEMYLKLINSNKGIITEDYFNYAMTLKMNGKHSESTIWMEKFLEQNPNDLRANSYLHHKIDFKSTMLDDSKYKIRYMNINSKAKNFNPNYYQNKIVFSSDRYNYLKLYNKRDLNKKPFTELYISDQGKCKSSNSKKLKKCLNQKMNTGLANFDLKGNTLAFTRLSNKIAKKKQEYQIYIRTFKNGEWSNPAPFKYNSTEYSVGNPHLTSDGKTMYFVSNMAGGFGGLDIYISTQSETGEWTKPENLGNKINTEGQEMFPFYEEKNNLFFFTSDGHNGFGGLDIFMCMTAENKYGAVTNMGFPLNSQYDDYGLIINDTLINGYFISNRSVVGFENIYSVELGEPLQNGKMIKGVTKGENGDTIPNVFVFLQEANSKEMDSLISNEDGSFVFLVEANKKYILTTKKTDHPKKQSNIDTFGENIIINADIIIPNKVKKEIFIIINDTILKGSIKSDTPFTGDLKMNTIYFEFNQHKLTQAAKVKLDEIVTILKNNPTMEIELGSFTDCSGSKYANQKLSDNRAKESLNYIKKRINNPKRISGHGYGENKLLNGCTCDVEYFSNCPDEENKINRRTEFIILKK